MDSPSGRFLEGIPSDSALEALWRDEKLCDAILVSSDGHQIKAHRIILASVSPFFRALFVGAGVEMADTATRLPTGEQIINLGGVDREALQPILDAIYTNSIQINFNNLEKILDASDLLGIKSIKTACCEYMALNVTVENSLAFLELSEKYSCCNAIADLMEFVCSRFGEILLLPEKPVGLISKSTLMRIIQSQDITADSEQQILSFGLDWIKADLRERMQHGKEVIAMARLPRSVLRQEISEAGLDPEELMPPPTQIVEIEDFSRTPSQILVAGGHDSSWRTFRTAEIYNQERDCWTAGPTMPIAFSLAGAASTGRSVLVVGGSMYDANVCLYDKRAGSWSRFFHLATSRIHSAVASMGLSVYVCGGRTGFMGSLASTEVFPFKGTGWRPGPDMLQAKCCLGLASLNGDLFAVGGQSERLIFDTVEVLNGGSDRWVAASFCLNTPRKYLSACACDGRVFVVGGMNEGRIRLSSVEALDPREGRWRLMAPISTARSSCATASVNGKLFVLGGTSKDDDILNTVELYEPREDKWIDCCPMFSGRSGLCAVGI